MEYSVRMFSMSRADYLSSMKNLVTLAIYWVSLCLAYDNISEIGIRKIYYNSCLSDGTSDENAKQASRKMGNLQKFCQPQKINLEGALLKIAALDNLPYFGLALINGKQVPTSGIDVAILNALSSALNFSYTVLIPEDGQWGIPLPDGNITGMVGMVARAEVDFAINEISISGQRASVIDFSVPYYMDSTIILTKVPQLQSKLMALLTPFPKTVWLLLLILVLSYGASLWLVHQYLITPKEKNYPSVVNLTLKIFQLMTAQGTPLKVQSWTIRFLLIGWLFFALLICRPKTFYLALYAGTLTAVYSSPIYEKAIDSIEDILKNEHVTPVISKGTTIHYLLETSTSGTYKQVYEKLSSKESFNEIYEEAYEKVLSNRRFAYIEAELTTRLKVAYLNPTRFHYGRQKLFTQSYAIACPQGSRLPKMFNYYLPRFVEMGLIEKWKNDELSKAENTKNQEERWRPSALSLKQILGAFVLYLIGISLATVAFTIEILSNRISNSSSKMLMLLNKFS